MPATTFIESLNDLVAAGQPFVSVTVVETSGSVPTEPGAKMLVAAGGGQHFGTVGGGELEQHTVDTARKMIDDPGAGTRFVSWNLDRDLGMTCAGVVKLFFEVYNVSRWNVVIFGAGHVAGALARVLVELDCTITVIDPREEWLAKLPNSPQLRTVRTDDMPSKAGDIPDDAFVLIMTMGHDTDRDILIEILRSREFPYLGVIGSASKAKRLAGQLEEAGIPGDRLGRYRCPIGLKLGSNHPNEIAISVAAEMIQQRDRRS